MKRRRYRLLSFIACALLLLLANAYTAHAQYPTTNTRPGLDTTVSYDSQGRPIHKRTNSGNDSLKHRDPLEDSITITYKFFDSTRIRKLDTSINDFSTRYPVSPKYVDLGNLGTAAQSLLFNPWLKPGFDAGFHAFDLYRYSIEDTKFYQTTRPFTELAYLLGSSSEQMGGITHTQNRSPNFNFAFNYRFALSPGKFRNQNTSFNNIRFNTAYVSPNKRYSSFFIFINNRVNAADNGGVQADSSLNALTGQLNSPFQVPTRLANNAGKGSPNPFNTSFATGTHLSETILMYRQQYDFGQKDSIVTDSSVIKLFYPRFRFQHTIKYSTLSYNYTDGDVIDSNYSKYFNMQAITGDTISYKDKWNDLTNELAIISYPEKNNLNQFLKLGAGYQALQGKFVYYNGDTTFGLTRNNIYLNGEYRNRTRNQKWDIFASGQFFASGAYTGDYAALISLRSQISKKLGYLSLGFQNVNRSVSFVYDSRSSFPSLSEGNFGKENITHIFANVDVTALQMKLNGDYYAITNLPYFSDFFNAKQYSSLFNVLHVSAEKKFPLSKFWNLYSEVHLQQKTGAAPVNLPTFFTADRLVFEGNFFKNLYLAMGVEVRYYSPYKMDNYSPFTGQFFNQGSYTTSNRPDINGFLHFRIKTFRGFIRLENLNTFNIANGSAGFGRYNFTSEHYAGRTLWLHTGIWWNFIN
ncbi:putative porin [Deminuibacter soli]|uniref:Porin n=1 Tax=Deminuibacter soli TaxID=2291815 RepID=A0A3E1NLH7_9BACT|nr:putative porin [Deminuibacter soli]RFM28772.1 hypothetical protein DXN05_08310 [Deminuibacter soli]